MTNLDDVSQSPHTSSLAPIRLPSTGQDLARLFEISPDALIIINQAGTIIRMNAQTEAMFGYAQEELTGKSLEMLLPQRFRRTHAQHRDHYFTHPRTRPMGAGLQLFGLRKDGTEFPVDISLRPLFLDDDPYVLGAIRDVTQQRLIEQERALQTQQIRLQAALINQAHDAILVLDPISRILSWNKGAEKLYGWTEQEALGRITHILLKTRFPLSRSALNAQLEQEGQWEGELFHTSRNGTLLAVESRQILMRDEAGQPLAILEINRDMTERQRQMESEQAAHVETVERATFLQHILDALPASVYLVYGADARLLLANQAASRIWGAHWRRDQPMLDFLSNNGIEINDEKGNSLSLEKLATIRAIREGAVITEQQETIRHPSGLSLPVIVSATRLSLRPSQRPSGPLSSTNEPIALVVHQDVTGMKEAEYLKDEFVGIAAHELRTPLAVLAGYADMLLIQTARGRGPALADWQQEALQDIKQAITRLSTLTEDLLDVTRLQAGRLTFHLTQEDISALVKRVLAQMQKTTRRHPMVIHSTVTSPCIARIDARRMEQVLTNLLGNAVKYSPQGGEIVITISEDSATQTIHISIADQGIGIPLQQQAQIFGRFVRADNAVVRGISGTGLGLYLCRELVERQGGLLWFESEEGKGSTFFLSLPLLPPHAE